MPLKMYPSFTAWIIHLPFGFFKIPWDNLYPMWLFLTEMYKNLPQAAVTIYKLGC